MGEFKRSVYKPYCTSGICNGRTKNERTLIDEGQKTRYKLKSVPFTATFCEQCGYTLYWSKDIPDFRSWIEPEGDSNGIKRNFTGDEDQGDEYVLHAPKRT